MIGLRSNGSLDCRAPVLYRFARAISGLLTLLARGGERLAGLIEALFHHAPRLIDGAGRLLGDDGPDVLSVAFPISLEELHVGFLGTLAFPRDVA